jgi:signal recognition particle receptor subunit beta
MVSINYAFREISCKIVYYGPGLSGKTTNLHYVHKKVPAQVRGELISLATDTDRTLFFDFLPLNLGAIQGFSTKFQLYTVPGQVFYNATRKLVLRGVDGLVFVADSQLSKMEENKESLNNLIENLKGYGYKLEEIPFILQYNKRDLPEVASIEQLQDALNHRAIPYYEAVAVKGIGVFDTLKGICKIVIENLKSKTIAQPAESQVQTQPQPEPVAVGQPVEKEIPLGRDIDTTEIIPSQVRKGLPPLPPEQPAPGPREEHKPITGSEPRKDMRPAVPEPHTERLDLDWKPVISRSMSSKPTQPTKAKKPGWVKRLIRFFTG